MMSSLINVNKPLKFRTFTACLLHLVSSFIEKKAEEISITMDLSEGFLYIVCQGIGLNRSELNDISNNNLRERCYSMINVRENYVQTLSNIAMLSEKTVVVSTSNIYHQAYKLVFKRGVKTTITETAPEKSVCTKIVVKGLFSDFDHQYGKTYINEYFILRGYVSAIALITYLIPITVTDRKFGEVIKWPGKYTGLGSAFSALIRSEANEILPVYANFKRIRMKAFLGVKLHYNKYFQYIYINHNYIKWKFLYKIFNHIIDKSFETSSEGKENNFMFVLSIECPDTDCLTHYRDFTTEIRPKNINGFVVCFYLLFNNIKMLRKCVTNVKNTKMSSIQIRSETSKKTMHRKNSNIIIKQGYLKILYNMLGKFFNSQLEYDSQRFTNPFELENCYFDLTHNSPNQFFLQCWLKLKRSLHNSHLNVCAKNDKPALSIICTVVTSLLNRWNSAQLKNIDISDSLMDTLFFYTTCSYVLGGMSFRSKGVDIGSYHKIKAMTDKRRIEKAIYKKRSNRKYKETVSSEAQMNPLYGLGPSCNLVVNCKRGSAANPSPNHNIANCVSKYDECVKSPIIANQQEGSAAVNNLALVINDYKKPRNENVDQRFSTVDRNFYIPKGTSPIIAKNEKINLKCNTTYFPSSNSYKITNERISSARNTGLYNKLHRCNGDIRSVSKEFFNDLIVIGQLDNKYIVCEFSWKNEYDQQEKNLIIFDQHGIDERVKLENMLNLIDVSENGNLGKYVMQRHWILLQCRNEELKLLLQFTNYFSKYGFEIRTYSEGTLIITSIPEILQWLAEYWTTTTSSYYYYLFTTLRQLVEEQLESILKTGSTTNVVPTVIHKNICRAACSSAVKFGRRLSLVMCEAIVNNLSKCKIPFMCAHGRPTAFFISGISSKQDIASPPSLGSLKQTLFSN